MKKMNAINIETHLTIVTSLAGEIDRLNERVAETEALKGKLDEFRKNAASMAEAYDAVLEQNRELLAAEKDNETVMEALNKEVAELKAQAAKVAGMIDGDEVCAVGVNLQNPNAPVSVEALFGCKSIFFSSDGSYVIPSGRLDTFIGKYLEVMEQLAEEKARHSYSKQ